MGIWAAVGVVIYGIWFLGFVLLKGGTNRELAQWWEASLYVAPVLAIPAHGRGLGRTSLLHPPLGLRLHL